MRYSTLLAFIGLSCVSSIVWADNPSTADPTNPAYPSNLAASNAMAFAIQAGAIAGAAQACGQDITTYDGRVNEALNRLAQSATDKLLAISNFQKSLQQAQTAQMNEHTIPCAQVMQDFNSLPIMRDDYETTVITQLSPTMGTSAPAAPLPIAGNSLTPMNNNNVATPNYGAINNSPNTNGNSAPPNLNNYPTLSPAVNTVTQTYPPQASQPPQTSSSVNNISTYPQMTPNNPLGQPTIPSPTSTPTNTAQQYNSSQPQNTQLNNQLQNPTNNNGQTTTPNPTNNNTNY